MAKVAGILGKKVGMTQLYDDKGDVHPATVLQAGPCVVTQHKTQTKDKYVSAQIGLVEFVKESRLTKPMKGHLGKHNLPPVKFIREVPIEAEEKGESDGAIKVGERVLVDMFEGERFVDVVGVSKGRGFAGVVRRHHFAGGPKSHGSMFQVTGSIGSSAFPSRVFKGMRMSGHMGTDRVTVRNLRILGVDKEDNLLVVEGSVPGPNGGYLISQTRNALRAPAYERTDVRLNKAYTHKRSKATLFLEVVNLTNRHNSDFDSPGPYDGVTGKTYPNFFSMFPILPSAGVVVEF